MRAKGGEGAFTMGPAPVPTIRILGDEDQELGVQAGLIARYGCEQRASGMQQG
jgi:hypothetical protein